MVHPALPRLPKVGPRIACQGPDCHNTVIGKGNRKYCDACRKARVVYRSKWHGTPESKIYFKQYHQRAVEEAKHLVYRHYGTECKCCGETNELFLSIDHINNDGATDRRVGLSGLRFYRYLINNNFPDTFQILCMNCNWGKRMNEGICPHEDE